MKVGDFQQEETDYHIACFVNISEEIFIDIHKNDTRESKLFSYPNRDNFKSVPLITSLKWTNVLKKLGLTKLLITIPNNIERLKHITIARNNNFVLINAIHPTCTILKDAIIADNVIIHAGAIIGYKTEIQSGVMINTNAQLDHQLIKIDH